MAAASFPFYFIMLQVPKLIVDDALGGKGGDASERFPRDVYGFELSQIEFLMGLCFSFLALVLSMADLSILSMCTVVVLANACCAVCGFSY